MTSLQPTRHAVQRMGQRALTGADLELIELLGVQVPSGLLVRRKECAAVERRLRDILKRIRHLQGKRLVVDGDSIITVYHARTRQQRLLLVRAEERELLSLPYRFRTIANPSGNRC